MVGGHLAGNWSKVAEAETTWFCSTWSLILQGSSACSDGGQAGFQEIGQKHRKSLEF